ncbi:MAG: hypothetical protein JRG97_08355 [Deltaproteobacteria bacterium]|nr:hypothetical protein [Deltaproteobacteria bacterium]
MNKMKHSKRKISNAGYLIALLEILARPVTEREKTAQPQIKYAFKPDELKKRLISEIVVPKTTVTSKAIQDRFGH